MNLNISLVQMSVKQTDVAANLEKGEAYIQEAARRGSTIVAFPEMWTTGFNYEKNIPLATQQEKTVTTVANFAKQYKIWVTGSMLYANEQGRPTNTAFLFNPAGNIIARYSKIHLFSYLHEDKYEAAGQCLTCTDAPWGATGLTVCYDIRFPELFRSLALKGALLIFSPIAFAYPRLDHWKVLVRARAIENQLFMIGTNQVGSENFAGQEEVTYFGHSTIIDPWGKTIIEAGDEQEVLLTTEINVDLANQIRAKMNVLKDRRPELYQL